jgi:membrane protease YdiL (CAAX protease family)
LKSFAAVLLPALLILLATAYAGHVRGLGAREMARGLPAIFLLLGAYFAFARADFVRRVARFVGESRARLILTAQAFLLPYLVYSLLLDCFSFVGFLKLALYVNLPVLVLIGAGAPGQVSWREGAALLLIWLPLELRWIGPLWPWPPGQSGYFLFGILGVSLAVFLFVVQRGMQDVGYTFAIRWRDAALAALAFLVFAPIAVAFGLASGFLHPIHRLPGALPAAGKVLAIFLATGVPEELLFRGLLQNLLGRWTGKPWLSVALAAILFGAAHLNNGGSPDWRYLLLATMAGLVYGAAYRLGGTLMAPALAHTLVDSAWALFFRGR